MELVLPAICTLVGGALSGLLVYFQQRGKNRQAAVIENNEQALKAYRDMVLIYQNDIKQINLDMNALEKEYLNAREDNAGLRSEKKFLMEKLEDYKKLLDISKT